MIKVQLHIHIKGDPIDRIPYNWKTLIDHAHEKNFRVLSFTCHKHIVFPLKAKKYAQSLGILLIKGIEIEIRKKHVIILNPTKQAEHIRTFKDLKKYKAAHPQILIMAPHPFHPGPVSLKKNLEKHIDLFDALEFSFYYTGLKNPNLKTQALAKKQGLPLIGTSDCHILKYFNHTYTTIETTEPLTTKNLIKAIKENKVQIHTTSLSNIEATKIVLTLLIRKLRKLLPVV
jgi:predicted metal-dependent phosphoesterase TrpH